MLILDMRFLLYTDEALNERFESYEQDFDLFRLSFRENDFSQQCEGI